MSLRAMTLAFIVLSSVQVRSEEPRRIMIVPFENTSASSSLDGLAEGAADLLTVCFSRYAPEIEVLDRVALSRLIEEKSLTRQGLFNDQQARQSLAFLAADNLIRGTLSPGPDGLIVSGFLYDVDTTGLLLSPQAVGPRSHVSALFCEGIAAEIAAYVDSDGDDSQRLQADPVPAQTQRLIMGLGHYYNGNYAAAFPAFMKLLREDSNNAEARFWLAKSFYEAGMALFAEKEIVKFLGQFPDSDKRQQALALLREIENTIRH